MVDAYDPGNEVTVTTGATQAIFTTIQALAHAGDEVIVFEPAYDSYIPAIRLAGATPVPLPLTVPGYDIDWDAVRARDHAAHADDRRQHAEQSRHRHPVRGRPAQFAEVTRGTDIVIVSDEVYEHMVYDGARHESLARHDELAARSVVIGSFGKTFHATGWKVGYALAPPEITAEIRRVHQFTVFTVNSAVQHGLAEFLRDPARYEACRRSSPPSATCCARRSPTRRSTCCRAAGSYFQLATLRAHQQRARRRVRAAAGARVSASRPYRCRRSTRTAPTTG